ncbi:MAG TPA: dihydroorotase, partial [Synergistales bacterium]|nr:dihydroorotase [Synergistales bacterium]
MKILLRNAILFDGVSLSGKETDVSIDGSLIEAIGDADLGRDFDVIHDLSGKILCPGFIDLHCHLRDPGQEWREDLSSGSSAGAAGGFTTLVCMPNTDPPLDSPALVSYVLEKSGRSPGSRILPAGCVSRERKGKVLAEMGKMAKAGAVIFTDDGNPVSDTGLLRLALQYSSWLGVRLMEHPEEKSLTKDAQVNEGICSSFSGLKGWPSSAEASDISRGVSLCRDTGVPIHFTHVSAEDSLRVLREAKASKLPVTFDVTPHHLCLSEENVIEGGYDSVFKVNPPLRSRRDRDALWEALAEGTVDAIATDHAPWHIDEK